MKEYTFYRHNNQIQPVMEVKTTQPTPTEVKNFKQELIQLLIQEVKRTTKIIENFNETLFKNEWENETEPSKRLSR